MGEVLFYIVKSSIYLFVFSLLYIWLLKGSTFFRFNRYTFWVGTILCMTLPLISLSISQPSIVQQSVLSVEKSLTEIPSFTHEAIPLASTKTETSQFRNVPPREVHHFPVTTCFFFVYAIGCIGALSFFSFSLYKLYRLIRNLPFTKEEKYRLILIPRQIRPFSWWKYIIMSEEDHQNNGGTILKHEKMHLKYKHSIDLTWMHVLLILHWFNPMTWILWRELQELHEYEADEGVISSGVNAMQYQMLLVKKAVGTRLYSMANEFNHSKLKNRISMMLKKRSNGWVRLRILAAVPVVAGVMYAFAQPEMKEVTKKECSTSVQTSTVVNQDSLMKFLIQKGEEYSNQHKFIRQRQGVRMHIKNNVMSMDDTVYTNPANFRQTMAEHLRASRIADKKKNGKDDPRFVHIIYDKASDPQFVFNILNNLKLAFDDLRTEYANQGAIDLDEVCPYAVYLSGPFQYGNMGIEVTIGSADKKKLEHLYTTDEKWASYQKKYGRNAYVSLKTDKEVDEYTYKAICNKLHHFFDHVIIVKQ